MSVARAVDKQADSPPSLAPERREILVPAKDLPAVLARNPRAVALTREQYEALLRDALKNLTAAPEPPRRAVLTSARYLAELHGSVVGVRADFTVQSLSEKWAEVPLRLRGMALGEIQVDGESALRAGGADAHTLIVRGRGEHRISAQFTLPVQHDSGLSSVALALPAAGAGSFTLRLPPRTHVESALPVKIENTGDATLATIAASSATDLALAWRAESDSAGGAPVIFEADSFLYVIDETKVQADLGILLNASLGELPPTFQITLPPGATPLQVQGSEVLKWNALDGVVTVELTPGPRKNAALRLLVESAALAGKKQASLVLPVAVVSGVHRALGKLAVVGSREIKVRAIAVDAPARQTEGAFAPQIEGSANFVAAYQFPSRTKPPVVTVEKIAPRFSADIDALVDVRREAIFIERVIALTADEGELFQTDLTLPPGEDLLTVREGDGSTEPDWTRAAGKIHIRWPDAVAIGARKVFTIRTRIEPADWATVKEFTLAVGDVKADGAEKTNGYIAAKSDEAFRIETRATDGLDKRDGRVTPVRGDFAWFRRNDFNLTLHIARRTPEVRATLTGYALPIAGALSVHAEIGYDVDFSGVKVFRVKVPKESAAQFYFDGEQIAERKLDGDTWTITLQKETLGRYALKVSAMLPFARGADAKFEIGVPAIVPLDVQRERGTWVVEANTDTEITFEPVGMNETDSLHAPALADYQPEHRIIGVFDYLGGQPHALKLLGERHASADVLTTVVDSMELNSVIATSGVDRHEAILALRTAGDQFLDIELPPGAGLLSLAVDGSVVKPVGESANVVRVQLVAKLAGAEATRIQLIYETPKRAWRGTGADKLIAPRLHTRIPILRTNWRVFLPEEYSYGAFDTNLQEKNAPPEPVLMQRLAQGLGRFGFVHRAYASRSRVFEPPAAPAALEPETQAATAPVAKPMFQSADADRKNAPEEAAKDLAGKEKSEARKKSDDLFETRFGGTIDYGSPVLKGGKISGLLPVQFELPLTGRLHVFAGLHGAQRVQFRYMNWWHQSRLAWVMFVVGALAFVFSGQNRAWHRMLFGLLVLTFAPLVATPAATGVCNALLAGWLVSFVFSRIASRFVFRPRIVEAMAKA